LTLLGVDYGERRIGLAITDAMEMIASPMQTLQNDKTFIARLKEIVRAHNVDTVVVGMPLKLDGSRGPAAEKTARFADELQGELDADVTTFDERLTTVQAERSMLRHDISRKKRAQRRDEMAAQFMLQTYMDAKKRKASLDTDNRME
jgi:putative Holliday junction resolvase